MRLALSVEGADQVADALAEHAARFRHSPRGILAEIAQQWADEVFPRIFDTGGPTGEPWAPLSALSVKLRGSKKVLEGEGRLRGSIAVLEVTDSEARVGTELGEIHQLGGRTSERSMIPGRVIPARPFLALDDAAIAASIERLEAHFFGEGR